MRKVILSAGISLDGYLARPDGSVDFLVMTKEISQRLAEFFAGLDAIIMGRKTFDETKKMGGGPATPGPTYVFSRSQPPGERDGVIFVNQSPATLVRKLRETRGKNIFHMGGGELARTFLEADLIDEMFLGVVPVLLGAGIPLFPSGFPQRDFTLVENATYSKGVIGLTYRRARRKPKRKA